MAKFGSLDTCDSCHRRVRHRGLFVTGIGSDMCYCLDCMMKDPMHVAQELEDLIIASAEKQKKECGD